MPAPRKHWAHRLARMIGHWHRRDGLVVCKNDFRRNRAEGFREGIGQNHATIRRDDVEGPWMEPAR